LSIWQCGGEERNYKDNIAKHIIAPSLMGQIQAAVRPFNLSPAQYSSSENTYQ
jgi:hypothetical protein